jgi:hypothetical protein
LTEIEAIETSSDEEIQDRKSDIDTNIERKVQLSNGIPHEHLEPKYTHRNKHAESCAQHQWKLAMTRSPHKFNVGFHDNFTVIIFTYLDWLLLNKVKLMLVDVHGSKV